MSKNETPFQKKIEVGDFFVILNQERGDFSCYLSGQGIDDEWFSKKKVERLCMVTGPVILFVRKKTADRICFVELRDWGRIKYRHLSILKKNMPFEFFSEKTSLDGTKVKYILKGPSQI